MKSTQKQHIYHIIFIYLLIVVGWGLECEDGEVDLGWGDCNEFWSDHSDGCMDSGCYNIEGTTELNYSYITLGQLTSNIGELVNLNYIHISDCGISGGIPSEIGNLENLISLQIYDNNHDLPDSLGLDSNLTGEIPLELGNLINLVYLDLRNNQLIGLIPSHLGNLSNLNTFLLSGNQLTSQIPNELGNLEELQSIDFSNNQLYGEIPESLFSLTNLTFLSLGTNQLNGNIPTGIGDLSLLYYLDLSSNNLIGHISTEIEDLELFYLKLNNNQLSGFIPSQFCNIDYLYLSENLLCPTYPDCLTEEELGYQDTSECEEPTLCNEETEVELWDVCYNIDETDTLDLGGNQLSGEIPSVIENLNNLTVLDLGGNQLSGEIPLEIFNLTNLTELELGGNQFSGEIPSVIGDLNNLTFLHLEYNQFSGEIPSELWNLVNLNWLNLVHNQFSGTISSNICTLNMNWSNPDNFNIYENEFCPPYPECIEDYIGYQDITNCSSESISELIVPIKYTLNQPFPNPFNPTTSISFLIPEQSNTSLKVYNIKGNLISTLLNQTMNVGHHQIEWNGENLSSGTYFIRINSGEFSDVKKVVLVK